jgi:hypothetical protein
MGRIYDMGSDRSHNGHRQEIVATHEKSYSSKEA